MVGPCLAALVAAAPAWAQDRTPAERQSLVDLARILGESHAIRQICEGPQDRLWYGRMQRLMQVEAADQALTRRLTLSFNAGYGAAKALYPECTGAARAEARKIARTAQGLSESLEGP